MKHILLFILVIAIATASPKSEIMQDIKNKDYSKAYSDSQKLLKSNKTNEPEILFMNFLAASGLHFTGQFTEEQVTELNDKYLNSEIETTTFKISSGDCHADCFRYVKNNPTELYLVKTFLDSQNKPAIVMMIYVTLSKEMSKQAFNKLNSRDARIKGNVESFDITGNMYKRLNLRISNAELILE